MIGRQEILDHAADLGLRPDVVEKDYVLGWLLAGITAHPVIGSTWVFKGGTCLKKCYFETYRFSEDLDFTVSDPAHLEEAFLTNVFNEIAAWVEERSGIVLETACRQFKPYDNHRGGRSCEGRVCYRGPIAPGGALPKIKLDLTNDEHQALQPVMRPVHHVYSDRDETLMRVQCYTFEEVFAEKIRALAERQRPRDLYDVINLFRREDFKPDRVVMLDVLRAKCAFKAIELPTAHFIETHPARTELEADWESMLGHQLPALPVFADFWQALPLMFQWLYGEVEKLPTAPIPSTEPSDTVQEPVGGYGGVVFAGGAASFRQEYFNVPMDRVRFAAANRLCINLAYGGKQRLIEPYSLRRSRAGHLLLMAVKHQTGEARSYRLDRIQGVAVSHVAFTPRYTIELNSAGNFPVQPTTRSGPDPEPNFYSSFGAVRVPRKSRSSYGVKYIYRCPMCDKTFTRTKMDSKLNPHKDQFGYPCHGRTGYFEDTRY
jgi:predicted nucleotidyltransferase component of viral defense system